MNLQPIRRGVADWNIADIALIAIFFETNERKRLTGNVVSEMLARGLAVGLAGVGTAMRGFWGIDTGQSNPMRLLTYQNIYGVTV